MTKIHICSNFLDQYYTRNYRNTFQRSCRYSATTTELADFPLHLYIIPMLNLNVAELFVIKNLFPF